MQIHRRRFSRHLVTMVAVALLSAVTAFAQTTPSVVTAPSTNSQTPLDKIVQEMGGLMPTNGVVDAYATYAPKAPKGNKWGGGIIAGFNVNQSSDSLVKVGLALGLDWLGQFSLVSGNVTFQAPFHPWPSKLPNLTITPVALVGIASPYSGDGKFNGTPVVVSDVGGYIHFGHALGGTFNVGAVWGKWSGSGPYSVARYHLLFGWGCGF